jgi:hypothetical protein
MKGDVKVTEKELFNNLKYICREIMLRARTYACKSKGFGMNEVLGVTMSLILAAFIIIPGLRDFSDLVMDKLGEWWTGISGTIFPKS